MADKVEYKFEELIDERKYEERLKVAPNWVKDGYQAFKKSAERAARETGFPPNVCALKMQNYDPEFLGIFYVKLRNVFSHLYPWVRLRQMGIWDYLNGFENTINIINFKVYGHLRPRRRPTFEKYIDKLESSLDIKKPEDYIAFFEKQIEGFPLEEREDIEYIFERIDKVLGMIWKKD